MLPAEKTHYRKGLALGMTLAETFCVVVFILLLACAALLLRSQNARERADAERDDARVDQAIAETILLGGDSSWVDTDAWYEEAKRLRKELTAAEARADQAETRAAEAEVRADEAQDLLGRADGVNSREFADSMVEQAVQLAAVRDSLRRADERLGRQESRQDSVEARMAEAERVAESIRSQVADYQDLTPDEADSIVVRAARADRLSREIENARQAVLSADARRRAADSLAAGSPADSLRARLQHSEQRRADAEGRAEYRKELIDQLTQGRGVDPPPCWMTADRAPEHIFRVELTDRGMRLHRIVPDKYADDEAALYAARAITDGREYSPTEFLSLTDSIYRMGRDRTDAFGEDGCRFWVQPVDLTGQSKDVYKERERQLWRRFWVRVRR